MLFESEGMKNQAFRGVIMRDDESIDSWAEEEFGDAELGNALRTTRLVQLATVLGENPTASLPEACGDNATLKAAYRFFDNNQIVPEEMLESHVQATYRRMAAQKVVLLPNDTMEVSLTHHPATTGLGRLSNAHARGLMVHSTEAMTVEGVPLGILQQHIWARTWPVGKREQRRELPIEEKESNKWLLSLEAVNAAAHHCPESLLVSLGDAESDVYDLFVAPRAPNVELLVRASRNRRLSEEGYLWETLQKKRASAHAEVAVGRHDGQPARTAKLSVRFKQVQLRPPKHRLSEGLPNVTLWAILAVEDSPPAWVEEPLEWLILSTLPLNNSNDALEKLQWYSRRFGIEIFHKVLKSGCQIEQRQFETAERIKRCMTLYSVISWRILYMTMLARAVPDAPCSVLLERDEWEALFCILHHTPIPPPEPPSIHDAVLAIARLGGFLGRKGDGHPGATVLWRGLHHLMDITMTYRIFHLPSPPPRRSPKRSRSRTPRTKIPG
jgi:hypothetical protein